MNKNSYLNELKNHDWTYCYASGPAYAKGLENDQRLKVLASADEELEALRIAYSKFVWGEGEEPTIDEATTQQPKSSDGYDRKQIFTEAWAMARMSAKKYGYPSREFFACALSQAWAKAKAKRCNKLHSANTPKSVFFICIDQKINHNTRLVDQPLIDEVFTDPQDAQEALTILSTVFHKPFIKTSKYYRLH